MQANRTLEIGTGLFVLLGFAALFFLAMQLPQGGLHIAGAESGYHVSADFDNIGDLKVGAPVTMSGVNMGQVDSIRFDSNAYKAVVGMRIYKQYTRIPDDSFASINTQGLLGGKYVGLSPGGSDTFLKEGSHIDQTQSAIVLESLINKLFASFASKPSDSQSQSADESKKSGDESKKEESKK
jgi:phospholipid/cholesterol/gamma-HCH transport system substrate-binding protein